MSWKISQAIVASFISIGCSSSISIEERDVPYQVVDSFKARYPNFNSAKWEIEKEGDRLIYEVDFMSNGIRMKAEFTKLGEYIGEYVFLSRVFKESFR